MTPVRNCANCGGVDVGRCASCSGKDGWPNWERETMDSLAMDSLAMNVAKRVVGISQEERRMDIIGQNGNTGEHYGDVPGAIRMAEEAIWDAYSVLPATAPNLLKKAVDIMEERGRQYDSQGGERSMGKAVAAFNAITGQDLSEAEGWLLLQVLKDVRQWQKPGYHADSAEDCIAYAALKAEALARKGIA